MSSSAESPSWHSGLTPKHWRVLTASFLGWVVELFTCSVHAEN